MVRAMENEVNYNVIGSINNKVIMNIEDSMVMNGIYGAETLEKLITTVHKMHNITAPNERLFTSKLSSSST